MSLPEQCDVVVAGGGGAGFCAAMRANQLGKKVILLEKAPAVGGSAAMARGLGAVDARDQKNDPKGQFTIRQLLRDWMEQTNYLANYPLIYTYLRSSGETVDWLQELGCKLDYVGSVQEKHRDSLFQTYFIWDTYKAGEMRRLVGSLAENGGKVMTKTTADQLIVEDGKVTGVWAEQDGERFPIYAKAVILCTGGYGNNPEMMAEATGGVKANGISTGYQTGDGIQMGLAIGADTENLHAVEFHGCDSPTDKVSRASIGGHGNQLSQLCEFPATLWVNHQGLRFTNEEVWRDISYIGNVTHHQGNEYFILMTQKMIDILAEKGAGSLGVTAALRGSTPEQPWGKLKEQLKAGLEVQIAYVGDTLRQAAEQAGVDADALETTVNEYNRFCAQGVDEMYGKDPGLLHPIEEGRYYLIEGRANYLCTLGGLRIDPKMRVHRADRSVIPGLYAAGCDASGGLVNNAYVSYEGVTLGWACTSGRLAGEAAAAYLDHS
jgi:fumarate reductase flavoprotein subunit